MSHTIEDLNALVALPPPHKVALTKERIKEWYDHWDGNVYVSFSGGKDSTVLLHIVRQMYPEVKAVFSNTGLEYPETVKFVKSFDNVDLVRPKMTFADVITTYGYPIINKETAETIHYARSRDPHQEATARRKREELLGQRIYVDPSGNDPRINYNKRPFADTAESKGRLSKYNKDKWLPLCMEAPFKISHYCCEIMKKSPMGIYDRRSGLYPMVGTMTEESRLRRGAWLRHGCNVYEAKHPVSQPLSFWTAQDILYYIKENNLPICSLYGDIEVNQFGELYTTGSSRLGCSACLFTLHRETKGDTRFQVMKQTHPKLYEFCMGGGQWIDNPDYDPNYDGTPDDMGWVYWNPPKLWIPSKEGLGMKFVLDFVNDIYGKRFCRYE